MIKIKVTGFHVTHIDFFPINLHCRYLHLFPLHLNNSEVSLEYQIKLDQDKLVERFSFSKFFVREKWTADSLRSKDFILFYAFSTHYSVMWHARFSDS